VFGEKVEWREYGEGVAFKGRDAAAGACIQSLARKPWRRHVAVALHVASGSGASIRDGNLTLCRRLKLL
jgi:hypothetical protein